mmetsp:Transcript_31201/g.81859  ORF Transcript_31201/g.81859 Transcript_31201/m.81859 type:complete len:238 (+) Transcript_31201:1221-1934(+)
MESEKCDFHPHCYFCPRPPLPHHHLLHLCADIASPPLHHQQEEVGHCHACGRRSAPAWKRARQVRRERRKRWWRWSRWTRASRACSLLLLLFLSTLRVLYLERQRRRDQGRVMPSSVQRRGDMGDHLPLPCYPSPLYRHLAPIRKCHPPSFYPSHPSHLLPSMLRTSLHLHLRDSASFSSACYPRQRVIAPHCWSASLCHPAPPPPLLSAPKRYSHSGGRGGITEVSLPLPPHLRLF